MPVKQPKISVTATEELLEVLMQAAAAMKASRKTGVARAPAVLNALIVQVSTARGTFEHAQKAAAALEASATESERKAGVVPIDDTYPVGDPRRYGGVPDGLQTA